MGVTLAVAVFQQSKGISRLEIGGGGTKGYADTQPLQEILESGGPSQRHVWSRNPECWIFDKRSYHEQVRALHRIRIFFTL